MQIKFRPAADGSTPRLIARFVEQDAVPADLGRAASEGAQASRFSGKAGQVFETFAEADGRVERIALVGIGSDNGDGRESALERAGAALAAKYMTSGETALAVDASCLTNDDLASVLAGIELRAWRYDVYRTTLKDEQKVSLTDVVVIGAREGAETAWQRQAAVTEGVMFTRELVAEPANVIYPESFVARCQERFKGTGAELTVLDDKQMAALGMGALLGVAQGSRKPARLLAIRWNGGGTEAPTLFVGKGVTFDTGGISIKPAAGMEDMKWDMGGAGAVAGAMLGLAKRNAKANVIGVCGLVENMPDGNAQRPGDVVTSMDGQTIEVINTDAEGRLVLCDAITWAQREFSPARLIDLATLTGAMIIALGHEHGGIFSNDETLADSLLAAGTASGDKLWRFPLSPVYDKLIDSEIADIKNVGPRYAGSITAAQFIQRFVKDGLPWAHLDIAGMVWADKPGAVWGKGATGFGVRLIDRFVRDTLET
ncbi:MAG: leucyl aminopeptidase [Croceibacterium sp.]